MQPPESGTAPTAGPRRARVAIIAAGCGAVMLAVWSFGRHSSDRQTGRPIPGRLEGPVALDYQPPSVKDYVGSEACAVCHGAIAESYQSHPMSHTIRRVDAETTAGLPPRTQSRVVGKQRILEAEVHGGELRHHELMFDETGEVIYDQAVPMEYVVGSGRRATAYLYQREGLLLMSPLNWYSRSAQWDLAPGYRPDDARRFDRRVTDACLSCHAGRVAPAGRSPNVYQRPPFHELSVGCENCHGPGRQHVALREARLVGAGQADPIVNPARLDPARRDAVCAQCHLQAAARIPRPGRTDLDFRPGQSLEEIWTVLDEGSGVTEDGRTRSVSHVQQMRESRCYAKSGGRFGCISCHDPHGVPTEAGQEAFYRNKCLQCHAESPCSLPPEERLKKEDSCIACHMPAREASNVSHVSQTDHRVIRATGRESPERTTEETDSLTFFDRADLRLEAWERDRAAGLAAWKYLSGKGRPRPAELIPVLEKGLAVVPDDGLVLIALGSIAADNRLVEEARGFYERARSLPDAEEAALSGLLDIYYVASDEERALECADRLLRIDPGDARVHAIRADVLKALGRLPEGIAAAERSLELNPTLIPVRQWLVDACRNSGRDDERRLQERTLLRMKNARPPRR